MMAGKINEVPIYRKTNQVVIEALLAQDLDRV
jgi:hypothetical protein